MGTVDSAACHEFDLVLLVAAVRHSATRRTEAVVENELLPWMLVAQAPCHKTRRKQVGGGLLWLLMVVVMAVTLASHYCIAGVGYCSSRSPTTDTFLVYSTCLLASHQNTKRLEVTPPVSKNAVCHTLFVALRVNTAGHGLTVYVNLNGAQNGVVGGWSLIKERKSTGRRLRGGLAGK